MNSHRETEQPPVAVLIAVYSGDRPDHLQLALDSILQQAGQFRVRVYLCVDGPLPAPLAAVIDAYESKLHRKVINSSNKGLALSLNSLIELLDDEQFVFRMDADDISLPDRFQQQLEWLRDHPELDLIGTQAFDIDEAGERLGDRNYPVDAASAHAALERVTPILHPSFCARRALFRDAGFRYTNSYLTEDLALLIDLDRRGFRFSNVPARALAWRVGRSFQQRRRSVRRGLAEFALYGGVIFRRRGPITWRYIFPVARLVLSLLPPRISGLLRNHRVRSLLIFGRRHQGENG